MRNKIILFSSFVLVSSSALAGQSLLEEVATQAAKDTATAVAPNAAEKVESINQTLENAKNLKEGVENAPAALKGQAEQTAKEAVKQKINDATPEAAKKATETLGKVKSLKEKAVSEPKATQALKNKAKKRAVEKTLDLLR